MIIELLMGVKDENKNKSFSFSTMLSFFCWIRQAQACELLTFI